MKLKDLKLTVEELVIKNEIERLVKIKFQEFGLTDWTFVWGTAFRIFGTCDHSKKTIRMSLLKAVADFEEAKDTLLHEMAHALVGPENGHNNKWIAKAIQVGARPERCGNQITTRFKKPYQLKCTTCDYKQDRTRKVTSIEYGCPVCSKQYDDKYKLIWTNNNN